MKIFLRQIYSYNFYIFKLHNLRVIHDLYSQGLTQTLSKTSIILVMKGVPVRRNLVFFPIGRRNLVFVLPLDKF